MDRREANWNDGRGLSEISTLKKDRARRKDNCDQRSNVSAAPGNGSARDESLGVGLRNTPNVLFNCSEFIGPW